MYDARPKIETIGTTGRLVFACLAGCLVVGALSLTLLWPSANTPVNAFDEKHQVKLIKAEANIFQIAFKGYDIAVFDRALLDFDLYAHQQLEAKLQNTTNRTDAVRVAVAHMHQLLGDHKYLLEHLDTQIIDSMLTLTRARLKVASQNNNAYCMSSHYMALAASPTPAQALTRLLETLPGRVPGIDQYGFELMAILLEGMAQARDSPASHGRFTSVDRQTLQVLLDSLKTDPQIAPLLARPAEADQADMCAIGASLIMAANTLPQVTKGRLWVDMVRGGSGLKGR